MHVGRRLEVVKCVRMCAERGAASTSVPDPPLDVALGFGTSRPGGINVETKRLCVPVIDWMDDHPRSGPRQQRGLLVVDPTPWLEPRRGVPGGALCVHSHARKRLRSLHSSAYACENDKVNTNASRSRRSAPTHTLGNDGQATGD